MGAFDPRAIANGKSPLARACSQNSWMVEGSGNHAPSVVGEPFRAPGEASDVSRVGGFALRRLPRISQIAIRGILYRFAAYGAHRRRQLVLCEPGFQDLHFAE
jgi:hypothetical protein